MPKEHSMSLNAIDDELYQKDMTPWLNQLGKMVIDPKG